MFQAGINLCDDPPAVPKTVRHPIRGMNANATARFQIGYPVLSRGFLMLYDNDHAKARLVAAALLDRHVAGDWGDLCEQDRQANEDAVVHGDRLLSKYTAQGRSVYVITEADRAYTTILLADEY